MRISRRIRHNLPARESVRRTVNEDTLIKDNEHLVFDTRRVQSVTVTIDTIEEDHTYYLTVNGVRKEFVSTADTTKTDILDALTANYSVAGTSLDLTDDIITITSTTAGRVFTLYTSSNATVTVVTAPVVHLRCTLPDVIDNEHLTVRLTLLGTEPFSAITLRQENGTNYLPIVIPDTVVTLSSVDGQWEPVDIKPV